MRLEPIGNPIDEKAGEVAGLLSGWTADAVGGRNLIRGTTTAPTERSLSATSYYWDMGTGAKLEAGVEYTFSVIVDKISDDDTTVGIELGLGNGNNYRVDLPGVRLSTIPYGERVTLTFVVPEDRIEEGVRDHLGWRIRNSQKAVTVAYRELKLERGPVATPWTPAPEDLISHAQAGDPLSSFPSPFPAHDPALTLWADNSVGTRIFAGSTMIYGDTGLRSIDHLLLNGWVSEVAAWPIRLRRVGDVVELRGYVNRGAATSQTLLELPEGFGVGTTPPTRAHGIATGTTTTGVFHLRVMNRRIDLPVYETWVQGQMYLHATWTTTDAWPTLLP